MKWRGDIVGCEKEYGIMPPYFMSNENPLGCELFFQFAPILVLYSVNPHFSWLKNGGRLYVDCGITPEYASPECRTAREYVIWSKAGDFLLREVVEKVNIELWNILKNAKWYKKKKYAVTRAYIAQYVKKSRIRNNSEILRIYRNSIDYGSKDNSENTDTTQHGYGEHENYLVKNNLKLQRLYDVLMLHCISRFWQGSGHIEWDAKKKEYQYHLFQREICTDVSSLVNDVADKDLKPILLVREEPDNTTKWRRIQIIGGDSNMAEIAIRLKVGTTAMLIQMFERGFFDAARRSSLFNFSHIELRDCYRIYARDCTMRKKSLLNGKELSALDIQRRLLELAQEFFLKGHGEVTEEVSWQLKWWQKILDLVEGNNPLIKLAPYTDVGQKYLQICNDMERYNYSWKSSPSKKLQVGSHRYAMTVDGRLKWWNLEYHRISRRYGIFQRIEKSMPMKRVCTNEEIVRAISSPPPGGRAQVRVKVLREILRSEGWDISTIQWNLIEKFSTLKYQEYTYPMNNPYESTYHKEKWQENE